MEKKFLVYQITNKLTNMIYIGVHLTENINDGYMGSGVKIRKAIKEIGLENFEKIILYEFDNEYDMLEKERELVDRNFIAREDTYNVILGGGQWLSIDLVTVKDKDGNTSCVNKNDSRYLSGELVSFTKGKIQVKDENDNHYLVSNDDPRYLSGEYISIHKNMISVKNNYGVIFYVKNTDPRYLSGELVHVTKGLITVKDSNNNHMSVSINDPRYLSGELIPNQTGRNHTEEAKKKISDASKLRVGTKSSRYNTCWITNNIINKNIKKEELDNYLKLNEGWIKGRINGNEKQPKF